MRFNSAAALLLTSTTVSNLRPCISFPLLSFTTTASQRQQQQQRQQQKPSFALLDLVAFQRGQRGQSSISSTNSSRSYFTSPPSSSSFLSSPTQRARAHRHNLVQKMSSSTSSSSAKKEVALLQFQVSSSKVENQQKVQQLIDTTIQNNPNVKLIVLPEIWNGPYATAAFPEYAEILPPLGYTYSGTCNDSDNINMEQDCPSAKILFEAAKKYNIYIVGGSISEKENDSSSSSSSSTGTAAAIYNTCLCISPQGKLVAKHRKVHLFDIDVKGGITFRESDTLTAGDTMSVFDTGSDLFGMIGVGIWYVLRVLCVLRFQLILFQ